MLKMYDTDDKNLVDLVKDGSKDAFSVLYNRYGRRIHRFAVSYLKSDHEAEELVQDIFLKLWDKKEKLDSSQNIQAFIFKIAVNTIYDFIRRKNIEKAFQEYSSGKLVSSDSTWDEIVFNDMLSQVQSLIEKIPEQRRKIFKLSREECLTNDEIAEKLGLSKRTIENQLYRATMYLKQELVLDSSFALLFFYLFC